MKLLEQDKKRLQALPRYDTKEAALKEAVKATAKGDDICTVAQEPNGGKFVVCNIAHKEVVYARAGYTEVYGEHYVLKQSEPYDTIKEV